MKLTSVGRKPWASADKLGPNNAVRLAKPAVKPRADCRTPATIFSSALWATGSFLPEQFLSSAQVRHSERCGKPVDPRRYCTSSTYLKTFSEEIPKIKVVLGVKLLASLNDCISIGKMPPASSHLPNVILCPLVLLSQLTQYTKYLKLAHRVG